MLEERSDKQGTVLSGSNECGINVSIPNVGRGDKVISFTTRDNASKAKMRDQLLELRKKGQLLSLRRGEDLRQIHGYDPKKDCWQVGNKPKTAEYIPVEDGDNIHVVVPQSGG